LSKNGYDFYLGTSITVSNLVFSIESNSVMCSGKLYMGSGKKSYFNYGNVGGTGIDYIGPAGHSFYVDCGENSTDTGCGQYYDNNASMVTISAGGLTCNSNIVCSGAFYNYKSLYITSDIHNTKTNTFITRGGASSESCIDFICEYTSDLAGYYFYLQKSGTPYFASGNCIVSMTEAGITGTMNTSSDYRLKENIMPISDEFSVDKLNPCVYNLKDSGKLQTGFIAHELQEVFPHMVNGEKDGEEMQSVNYIQLIAILTKEIQDLKKRVLQLESK
jgi:hypothetical protein